MIRGLEALLGDRVVVSTEESPLNREDIDTGTIDTQALSGLGNSLLVRPVKDGFLLVFGDQLLFPPGEAELSEGMAPVLKKIADFINISGYRAYITGHTDSIPVQSGRYTSNDQLSLKRSLSILNYLVRKEQVFPGSLAISGLGALQPVADNKTPAGRARNRRVEIVLKNKTYY
jgi:chemotaxis protein MotB